jgi:hypothetical protein
MTKCELVTGACGGLIGSEVAVFSARQGFRIVGIDSNHRAAFSGWRATTESVRRNPIGSLDL